MTFLYWFLPAVLIAYFILPGKLKNFVLLAASLLFYFWGEPVYTAVMLLSALIGYAHGLLIDRARTPMSKKAFLISSVVFGVGVLGFFKYSDFFIANVNALTGSGIALLRIALPIGISFYTFQILSYTIDVYRGKARVQKNPLTFCMYVTLFPQLIAGPIVRYQTVQDELDGRTHSLGDFAYGVTRFVLGLGKKVLLANTLAELGASLGDAAGMSVLGFWLKSAAFMLQIYFDFSGYSDMAIGLGRMLGFHFDENFNYPYISKSISEFWRRWHMSLGTWFRDYVYIPLGGNRCSRAKWFRNVLVVWLLTGFWHGAEWNFIVWGLYFAVFLLLERGKLGEWLERAPDAVRRIYVLAFVNFSFVIFNASNMADAIKNLGGMFGAGAAGLADAKSIYLIKSYALTLAVAAIASTPLLKRLVERLQKSRSGERSLTVLEPVVCALILIVATSYLVDGSFNPFLYFRF